jgi:hypothetical protein
VEARPLIDDEPRNRLRLGAERYDDVADYVDAFQAAIRTHRQLADDESLLVEIEPDAELPLIQRAMLR